MRTTVTLDADTEAAVRRLMAERGVSFKQALNDAIRTGAEPRRTTDFHSRARALGQPTIVLDRALRLAADLEDEALIRAARADG